MNTYGLEGESVDQLLSLRKLADTSKEQYLNSIRQFPVYSKRDPDPLDSNRLFSAPSYARRSELASMIGAEHLIVDSRISNQNLRKVAHRHRGQVLFL